MSESLRQAMTEAVELKTGEAFEIIYHGGSSPGSKRTIMPLKVDGHLVYAKCFDSDSEKNFRFDRMEYATDNSAPSWKPFDTSTNSNSASKKKTGFFASMKKSNPDPMSNKAIFGVSALFALVGFFFLGPIGFLIIYAFFVYAGLSHNRDVKKKAQAKADTTKTVHFAPTSSTNGKTASVDVKSTAATDSKNTVKNTSPESVPTPTTKTEAHKIINSLKTKEEIESFVQACYAAQDSIYDDHPTLSEKQIDRIYSVLSDAIDQAEYKTLSWQFVPDVHSDTPLDVLEIAFKEFSSAERLALPAKFRTEYGSAWLELTYDSEPDLKEEFLDNLIEFRKIVESDLQDDAMANAIDAYLSEHPIFSVEYFGKLDDNALLTHGQEWMASKLAKEGLPSAWELYAEGYTTIEKCLAIEPDEFIKRKGIGPKKKQQLIEFQNKHRK
ncbi:MAG: hypothetical protein DSY85_03090 [Marinomonas sp.]|nr:MAG: hypothetical protein DSY85_03090 [Marinomonas sp.]